MFNESVKVLVAQPCLTLCDPMGCPWNSPGQNTGVGNHFLLQEICPTQGSNPGLLYCGQILYCLNHPEGVLVHSQIHKPFGSMKSFLSLRWTMTSPWVSLQIGVFLHYCGRKFMWIILCVFLALWRHIFQVKGATWQY